MKRKSFLNDFNEEIIEDEDIALSSVLDELFSETAYINFTSQSMINPFDYYNFAKTSKANENFEKLNRNKLLSKIFTFKWAHQFYINLYDSIKNNGLIINEVLKIYSQSNNKSMYFLYKQSLSVYETLNEQEKNEFKNNLNSFCEVSSGRFQPFISHEIDWVDEKNIKNLKRVLNSIQKDVKEYLEACNVNDRLPTLVKSEHLLLEIRKRLFEELGKQSSVKYKEYLENILKNRVLRLKEIYGKDSTDTFDYVMGQLDITLSFIEGVFKTYKKIDNPNDINFNQMIELLYFSCKEKLLKEVTQKNLDKLDIIYEHILKLENDYVKKYNSNIYDDLKKVDLATGNEYDTYLERLIELGYSKALYDYLLMGNYHENIELYKLNLINSANNKSIDLDLYNELVFAKNLKYLVESKDKAIIRWLIKGDFKWDEPTINDLKMNIDNLYSEDSVFNKREFAKMQSDFIVPDELLFNLPIDYKLEDVKVKNISNKMIMGIVLKQNKRVTAISPKEYLNYYLLHIEIDDIKQEKTPFAMQMNLLVGSDIKNRIQIYRMDNYVSKGVHKNTGAIKLDTTTHIHKYNALNKVRKNLNGEMDIYKNWEDGVKNFDDGLDKFLSEIGMSGEIKEKIKLEVSSKIKTCKNMRV